MPKKLILNIPHSSTLIPEEDRKAFLISGRQLEEQLLHITDWYTEELFDHSFGKAIIAPVSRLVCDTERFSQDELEPMSKKGMGFCYKCGYKNEEIKRFDQKYKDEVFRRYYLPHHTALTETVQKSLEENNYAFILDCHSFSADPIPYEPEQADNRPDICIGTDDYHTPQELADYFAEYFRNKGYSVAFNTPYAGSIVPISYYQKDKRVKSIMVEVNRRLYLQPGTSKKNDRFKEVRKDLYDLQEKLTQENLQI